MFGFISRIFNPIQYSPQTAQNLHQEKNFPISRSELESLRHQISAVWNLRLSRDKFLSLAISTLIEARKGVLQCNSVRDVDAILDETDAVSQFVFQQLGHHVPRFRFALRLEYFKQAIGLGVGFNVESFKTLQNHVGFPAHKQIQQELVRSQMEADLDCLYGISPCRDVQRLNRHSIATVSKPQYAQHCLNLFNLGIPLDANAMAKLLDLCRTIKLPDPLVTEIQNTYNKQHPAHLVITRILHPNNGMQGNHNSHPSSRVLELLTGFVFHPNNTVNLQQLLNQHSPLAFQNIPALMVDKYIEASLCNRTRHFFENAFAQQDPCFEATVENLIQYTPVPSCDRLEVFPAPRWTPLARTAENIDALIDWQEMATLVEYVKVKNIDIKASDHQKIDQLLASPAFQMFICSRKNALFNRIYSLIPKGTPHQLQTQLDVRWH